MPASNSKASGRVASTATTAAVPTAPSTSVYAPHPPPPRRQRGGHHSGEDGVSLASRPPYDGQRVLSSPTSVLACRAEGIPLSQLLTFEALKVAASGCDEDGDPTLILEADAVPEDEYLGEFRALLAKDGPRLERLLRQRRVAAHEMSAEEVAELEHEIEKDRLRGQFHEKARRKALEAARTRFEQLRTQGIVPKVAAGPPQLHQLPVAPPRGTAEAADAVPRPEDEVVADALLYREQTRKLLGLLGSGPGPSPPSPRRSPRRAPDLVSADVTVARRFLLLKSDAEEEANHQRAISARAAATDARLATFHREQQDATDALAERHAKQVARVLAAQAAAAEQAKRELRAKMDEKLSAIDSARQARGEKLSERVQHATASMQLSNSPRLMSPRGTGAPKSESGPFGGSTGSTAPSKGLLTAHSQTFSSRRKSTLESVALGKHIEAQRKAEIKGKIDRAQAATKDREVALARTRELQSLEADLTARTHKGHVDTTRRRDAFHREQLRREREVEAVALREELAAHEYAQMHRSMAQRAIGVQRRDVVEYVAAHRGKGSIPPPLWLLPRIETLLKERQDTAALVQMRAEARAKREADEEAGIEAKDSPRKLAGTQGLEGRPPPTFGSRSAPTATQAFAKWMYNE